MSVKLAPSILAADFARLGDQVVEEDDHMNVICLGGRTIGSGVAWDLVQTFLAAEFSQAPRHLRRLSKVAMLERQPARTTR